MAPEVTGTFVVPGGAFVTPAIDVWAAGCFLYNILTRQPLFEHKSNPVTVHEEVAAKLGGISSATAAEDDKAADPGEVEDEVSVLHRQWSAMVQSGKLAEEQQRKWVSNVYLIALLTV